MLRMLKDSGRKKMGDHSHPYQVMQLLQGVKTKYWVWRSVDRQEEEELWCRHLNPKQWVSDKVVLEGHFYFSDVEACDCHPEVQIPAWINMVRDPVNRYHSQFYYLRQKSRWRKDKGRPFEAFFNKSMNTCILTHDPECDFRTESMGNLNASERESLVTFFCGNAIKCRELGSEAALQQAKYNIERHYAVVGFLEDMDSFLHILARVLPQFFSGIDQRKFEDNGKLKVPQKNKGSTKVPLSEEARTELESQLWPEYDLSDFIRRRLEGQKRALRIT